MKIVIAGCGKIGVSILSRLAAEGHEIVAIDSLDDTVGEIGNIYDVMTVCGSAVDFDTLNEADVGSAELFVAVTGSDEMNMLSCFIAKGLGAKHTVARIRDPGYDEKALAFMKQQLGLSLVINPELFAAEELFNILKLPAAVNIETFSGRKMEMVELVLKPDSALDGISLADLRRKYKAKFLVCAVSRGGEVYIPDGSFVLKSGDRIGLTAAPTEVQKLLKMLGLVQRQARRVMILGGSTTAFYLAEKLLESGNSVTVIERDRDRCEKLSAGLPQGAVVIHGDGAQQELLLEEGLTSMDAFVSLTGMDEENILISYFATSKDVQKVIAKVNRPEYAEMAERLGLDSIISPKRIISDVLARYARALQNTVGSSVETLYRLMDGNVEALEFNVSADFKGLKVPLKDIKLKPNILIAGITRGRKAIIPSGEDVIQAGDRVVVIASEHRLFDLDDILLQ